MKKVWFILGLIALGFVVQNFLASNERIRIAEEEEAARIELEFSTALNSLIGDTGANDIWMDNLCASDRGGFRRLQIFSVELEKLWLDGKPILFEGSIHDVASHSESFYTVEFQHSNLFSYLTGACFLRETLRLELRAPKSLIDPYLAQRQSTGSFRPPNTC
jgi:hypothetical protein